VARIIGIDLGTTNSCVAVLERGSPAVLPTPEGERTTPSVVSFQADGRTVVGPAARRQAVTNASRTVFGTKRLIGRKVNAADVQTFARAAPFTIVAAPNGDAWVRLPERDVSPQEISSYVIERMRRIAEAALGEPVTQAVVTVPAYFNDAQRQATRDAGRIAGLEIRRILNEPTAAALAYGVHRRKQRQRIAVFDLGGGTFDVSILGVESGVFEVLAVSGDAALGGDDFDRAIAEDLMARFLAETSIDLSTDPVALGRLKEEAEAAKKHLSAEAQATVHLPFVARDAAGQPLHLQRTLGRGEVETITRPLVDRLRPPCERALSDAGLTAADIDEVLLVGGMTRWPAVQAEVVAIFGKKPSKGANPDEIVALGAAAHGAILAGDMDDVVLLDVLPQSLGIRVGERFSVVIPRNTTIPACARKVFATTRDDQPHVTVEVYQGESERARENRLLGRLTLDGLPPGKAGSVRVELEFRVDEDGIMHLEAHEPTSGRQASLKVAPGGGLAPDELDRIVEARRAAAAAAAKK
jgi:molecular chaperone DnaK